MFCFLFGVLYLCSRLAAAALCRSAMLECGWFDVVRCNALNCHSTVINAMARRRDDATANQNPKSASRVTREFDGAAAPSGWSAGPTADWGHGGACGTAGMAAATTGTLSNALLVACGC